MAIQRDLGLPKKLMGFTSRDVEWLCRHLPSLGFPTNGVESVPSKDRARWLANQLDLGRRPDIVDKILWEHGNLVLHASQVEWIKKDERLCTWMQQQLLGKGAPTKFLSPMPASERHTEVIAALDCWQIDLTSKRQFLQEMRASWSEIMLENKLYRWIDGKNEDQCHWARDYLRKNNVFLTWLQPTNQKELHTAILSSLDCWDTHPAAKQLFIEKMKKTWSQKKHRDQREGKKQYNIVMGTDVKQKLDALAQHHGAKINETLEALINKEFEALSGGGELSV